MLDPLFVYGNYAEACLWAGLGLLAVFKRTGRPGIFLGVTLMIFGGSDVVEAHTGAWYDPWWLFVWKALCVIGIAGFGLAAWRQRKIRP